MSAGRSLLERFRRTAGVPAAAAEDLRAELLPVLAVLSEIDAEADRLREEARARARRRLADADAQAEQLLARARTQAEAERTRAEVERRSAESERVHAAEVAATDAADALRRRGLAKVPRYVERVLADVAGAGT